MKSPIQEKTQIVGFRATSEFARKFDDLCNQIGQNRSSVVRYALSRFMQANQNDFDNLTKVRAEMY